MVQVLSLQTELLLKSQLRSHVMKKRTFINPYFILLNAEPNKLKLEDSLFNNVENIALILYVINRSLVFSSCGLPSVTEHLVSTVRFSLQIKWGIKKPGHTHKCLRYV